MASRASQKPVGPSQQWRAVARAAGGALIFSLPMLMTMEMWWLGFYMDRLRLLVLFLLAIPLLMGLSRHIGFETTRNWSDDLLDSMFALGLGAFVSLVILAAFGTIGSDMSFDEIVGKVALQSVPAAIGALLARAQFARSGEAEEDETYGGELFLMAAGALFLGFNVAPTEEMILISYQMTHWHALALLALSVMIMHGFVFAVGFSGGTEISEDQTRWGAFVRFTLPGYAIALGISLVVLWLFGRTEGVSLDMTIMTTVVLAFPSAIGAAAARLIL